VVSVARRQARRATTHSQFLAATRPWKI